MTRLRTGLIDQAERYADTVMPGFTHLQVAQPVTFGHHLLAWNEMLARDDSRLADCSSRMNYCRWALQHSLDVIRHRSAHDGQSARLQAPTENSLDSVSDRDFAIEFTSAAAITMMHLSRMAEEMIIWTSAHSILSICRSVLYELVDHAAKEKSGCSGGFVVSRKFRGI